MRFPARVDLFGDRGVAFKDSIARVGANLTGAAMRMQIRSKPDASGAPLVSLSLGSGLALSYGGTDTIENHITADRISSGIYGLVNPATGAHYAPSDSVALSVIGISIAAGSMVAPTIPAAAKPGNNVDLAYDMLVTPSAGTEDKWFFGSFTVRGTVVQ